MTGEIFTPAIHLDVPWGRDIWLFLLRSPWYPLKLKIEKTDLSVTHGADTGIASIYASGDGGFSARVSVSGTGFKKVSLFMRRTIGSFVSDELVGEVVGSGTQDFNWKPIVRTFDLLLVTHGEMAESQLENIARGFGASITSAFLNWGSLAGDFIFCDGPLMGYSLHLKGDRGFLEHVEDTSGVTLTW